MNWGKKKLTEICKPKQWKIISQSELTETGYVVYGANGKMGYFHEFNHENPVLLIGCRGSCGSIHISEPFSYTNGNAMACDELSSEVDIDFLKYYLGHRGFHDIISGGVQKQITIQGLNRIEIPLPPIATQKRIAEILGAANALRRKDQVLLKKYDELAQGIFIDMFGDPVKNEMGWEVKKLKEICLKITDGTHFSPPNLPIGVPYITAKHLKQDVVDFYSNPTYISQKDHDEIFSRCTPEKGDVLYIKDGATTGIAAVNEYDFEFSMLSSLALIKPQKDKINSYYLSCYLNNKIVKQELIRCYMAGAAIKRFTLEKLNKFEIVVPHIELQNSFASRWIKLQESITSVKKSKATILFNSLIQKAFNGELVS